MFCPIRGHFPLVLDKLKKASCKMKHFSGLLLQILNLFHLRCYVLLSKQKIPSAERNINSSVLCSLEKETIVSDSGRNVWFYMYTV